jgi:CRISPR-associated protein Csb2
VFAGKDSLGVPLRENGHTHVLPLDEDRDGRIDHVLLWAPAGFDQRALAAVSGLEWLWGDDGFDLRVAFVGRGRGVEALGVPLAYRTRHAAASSRLWTSRTPFVLQRHPKMRGGLLVDGPREQLLREFARLGLPAATILDKSEGTDAPTQTAWHRFRLRRSSGGGSRGGDRGLGFVVEFQEPVAGPIAVGYGARQGLGQFEPVP